MTKRMTATLALATLMATPARAECLGDGCYDGLGLFLLGIAAAVVAILGVTGFAAYKLGKRHGIWLGIGLVVVVLLFGYAVFSGFL